MHVKSSLDVDNRELLHVLLFETTTALGAIIKNMNKITVEDKNATEDLVI